jgi:defect-in-organelle-trafficking protein DotD
METKNFFLITVLLLASITGCATKSGFYAINNRQNPREAEAKLSAAADSVSKSLQELAEISRAIHPQAKMPSPVEPDMIGMGQLGSIDWNGPIGPLVKKIAEATSYKLNVLGTQPAIPILISITAKDTPLADILRDAEFQCGNRANIVIYPASKIIELRYTHTRPL